MEDREVTSLRLFKGTLAKLDEIGRRIGGQSRGLVVEVLVALYGDQLTAETAVPARLLMSGGRRTNRGRVNSQAQKKPRSRKQKGGVKWS